MFVVLFRMGTLPIVRRKNFSDHIEYALWFVQQYKFVLYLNRLMDTTNMIYCYIFVGHKLVQKNYGLWEYVGGRSKGIHIYKGMTFEEFTHKVLEKFDISLHVMRMLYTLKFNSRVIQDLEDEDDLDNVVSNSDDFANVYIVESPHVETIEANISNTQLAFG